MDTVITKSGEKYYFTSEDQVYELNDHNFGRLKTIVTLPAKVYFRNCPFTFVVYLSETLFEERVNMKANRVGDTQDYEVSFSKVPEKVMR